MSKRLDLHIILEGVLGSRHVYFQPPATVKMHYPCIIYSRSQSQNMHANNTLYNAKKVYTVTVIDPNPDSEIPDRVETLQYSKFDRHFTNENLNHDVYTIYY